MGVDKILVSEQALEALAYFLAPGRAGIALKRGTAVGDELVEVVGHSCLRSWIECGNFRASSRMAPEPQVPALTKAIAAPLIGSDRRSLSSGRGNRECGAGPLIPIPQLPPQL